jgi:hypothetical protein
MDKGKYLLDTHSDHVREEVWTLFERAMKRIGRVSVLVEWDTLIPTFDVLAKEAAMAKTRLDAALA